jgi:hypothetical protein
LNERPTQQGGWPAETVVRAGGGIVWRRGQGGVVEIVLVHRPAYVVGVF